MRTLCTHISSYIVQEITHLQLFFGDGICSNVPGYYRGSCYGYGTVPGGRWTIDTEGGHVVDSVSR